ncbi:lipoyl domain-containing protein [Amycolatopsis sp. NPDC006131]|uniref:lipoyl domain-containing protein n=1 Tax=unclassified Amycolatopsis TaxID=2618356 RepID=UPI0033A430CC
MTEVLFPLLSEKDPDAEGVVATWFVQDGERVAEGDLLAEVAVDKVDVELSAPAAGVVRLLAKEGDALVQGALIARIE